MDSPSIYVYRITIIYIIYGIVKSDEIYKKSLSEMQNFFLQWENLYDTMFRHVKRDNYALYTK